MMALLWAQLRWHCFAMLRYLAVWWSSVPRTSHSITTSRHLVSCRLQDMITTTGAGSWPPCSSFEDSWPTPMRPYHRIFEDFCPLMTFAQASLDDSLNRKRIDRLRLDLRHRLQETISVPAIEESLPDYETRKVFMKQEACNGFFACIAFLRHMYR